MISLCEFQFINALCNVYFCLLFFVLFENTIFNQRSQHYICQEGQSILTFPSFHLQVKLEVKRNHVDLNNEQQGETSSNLYTEHVKCYTRRSAIYRR